MSFTEKKKRGWERGFVLVIEGVQQYDAASYVSAPDPWNDGGWLARDMLLRYL